MAGKHTDFQRRVLEYVQQHSTGGKNVSAWVIAQNAFPEKWAKKAGRGALVGHIDRAADAVGLGRIPGADQFADPSYFVKLTEREQDVDELKEMTNSLLLDSRDALRESLRVLDNPEHIAMVQNDLVVVNKELKRRGTGMHRIKDVYDPRDVAILGGDPSL